MENNHSLLVREAGGRARSNKQTTEQQSRTGATIKEADGQKSNMRSISFVAGAAASFGLLCRHALAYENPKCDIWAGKGECNLNPR